MSTRRPNEPDCEPAAATAAPSGSVKMAWLPSVTPNRPSRSSKARSGGSRPGRCLSPLVAPRANSTGLPAARNCFTTSACSGLALWYHAGIALPRASFITV